MIQNIKNNNFVPEKGPVGGLTFSEEQEPLVNRHVCCKVQVNLIV